MRSGDLVEGAPLRLHPDVGIARQEGARDVPAMLMVTSSPAPVFACRCQAGGSPLAKLAATTPHARRRRQPGVVLPLGGALAPVAPMCANGANSGEPTAARMVWCLLGGNRLERCAS
jgi:hypothetical protein